MQKDEYSQEQATPDDQQSPEHAEAAGEGADQHFDELEALRAAVMALREERLREQAELDNQRKRLSRDVDQARRFANERLLGALLPVFDSLEAGLNVSSDDSEKLREGMRLTLRQLEKVAQDNGLQPVDPVGEAFNPDRHQAMSAVASDAHDPDTVMQVYQKGYLLNDRLLRPALVVVAKSES